VKLHVAPLDKRFIYPYASYRKRKGTYDACGALPGDHRIDHRILKVQGSILDRITQVSSICDRGLWNGGLEIVRSWAPSNADEPYVNGNKTMDAYNHTIVADTGQRKLGGDYLYLDRGFAIDWELVDRERQYMTAEERERQGWMLSDLDYTVFGRRIFTTSRGFMGIGPVAAQVGDDVSVLFGGDLLYILRDRNDEHFEVVGECYVHGMTDGQACEVSWFSKRDFDLV
jgi:hypothetical protein